MDNQISTDDATPYEITIPNQGKLTGYILKSQLGNESVIRFAKVPYALPVTDEYRWRKPRPLPIDYDYTGDYSENGLKCPQPEVQDPSFNYQKGPSDENITWNNIWIPTSTPPSGGWPVFVYIHGGWLQYGEPTKAEINPVDSFDDFKDKYILVTPGYRLNIFGFLSNDKLFQNEGANFGFWDQREAIEWVYRNIKYFNGNPGKLTVGGLSAGSYSAFYQLSYEIYHPEVPQLIKQVVFFSNGVFSQPKTIKEVSKQFKEIVQKLKIDELSFEKQIDRLKHVKAEEFEDFIATLENHTFRAVTDDDFVNKNIIKDLVSGEYSKKVKDKGIRIVIGEVNNERYKYSKLYTPSNKDELRLQVNNYYNEKVVEPLLKIYNTLEIDESAPDFAEKLRINFGEIIGDGQVYASERGFINKLIQGGVPKDRIFRYRVSYRPKFVDEHIPKELGVLHGNDLPLWFYFKNAGFNEDELLKISKIIKPFLSFLNFKQDIDDWSTDDIKKFLEIESSGEVKYNYDPDWDWGLKVSNEVYKAQS